MSKHIAPLALLAAALLAPPLWAADGTMKFSGKLRENTCILDAGSRNQTVDMGTVSTTGGAMSMSHSFSVQLNNCPVSSDKVRVRFEGTPAAGAVGAYADKTFAFSNAGQSGAAKNEGFVISGGYLTHSPEAVGWHNLVAVNGQTEMFELRTGPGTTNHLVFQVGHIRLNDAEPGVPGTAVGNVQFSIDYP